MSEFEQDYLPGLPEKLPEGETLLWQGSPNWRSIARRALHVGTIAAYFAALAGWSAYSGLSRGKEWSEIASSLLSIAVAAGVTLGVLCLIARAIERTTIYSITSRRVVMRFGMALPMTLSLPFSVIGSADLKRHADGTGDIAFRNGTKQRLGFVPLWPHVRAWRINNPEPQLRCVPEGERIAALLVNAMREAARQNPQGAIVQVGSETSRPAIAPGQIAPGQTVAA